MKVIQIGPYAFSFSINTHREDRGRNALLAAKDRTLYGAKNVFKTPLERLSALESLDPFYPDIVGACRAIDGEAEHPKLIEFISSPLVWDDFYWDMHDEHRSELIEAVRYNQDNHPHWYPKPQVTDEDAPEAAAVIKQTLAAIDPDNPSDESPPDTEQILQAVQDRNDAAAEKRGEDFLES